jgi:hypothetical protein
VPGRGSRGAVSRAIIFEQLEEMEKIPKKKYLITAEEKIKKVYSAFSGKFDRTERFSESFRELPISRRIDHLFDIVSEQERLTQEAEFLSDAHAKNPKIFDDPEMFTRVEKLRKDITALRRQCRKVVSREYWQKIMMPEALGPVQYRLPFEHSLHILIHAEPDFRDWVS